MFNILEMLPQPFPKIKVVDVGAMLLEGSPPVYAPLIEKGLATVIGFEPVQTECDRLNSVFGSDHRFLPYVIGNGTRRTFHVCNFTMTSSIYEPNLPLAEKFQNLGNLLQVVRSEEVATHRLDDLEAVHGADFLKLDVQGAEFDILLGAEQTLAETVLIETEVEFVPIYKEQPLFAEVDQLLRKNGFLFHRMKTSGRPFWPFVLNNNPNQPMSQWLWGDAIYAKNFMRLGKLPPDKLLKLAVLLHVVYQSFDLVSVVLKQYDTQMNTQLWETYVHRFSGASA